MKVVLRVDASTTIGSGHVTRCLCLADGLAELGADVVFFCRVLAGDQTGLIESKGYRVYRLQAEQGLADAQWASSDVSAAEDRDAEACAALLTQIGDIDWLVVDHYGLGLRWELSLRPYTRNIMAIDDLGNRRHGCDLLLDQNLCDDPKARYENLVDERTRCLIGPRYALLRPEFRSLRPTGPRRGAVQRLLVFFGGADLANETGKTLRGIGLLARHDVAVDVVIGAMNPYAREIEDLSRRIPRCQILRNADMALLMSKADLAVGAGGTTAWERCSQGLPAMAWPIADNQEIVVAGLAKRGAIYRPDAESIADAPALAKHLYALINNPALISLMSERALAVCDGLGVDRAIAAMRGETVSVRTATAADVRKVYEWRNDPKVRAASIQAAPIEWEAHARWFRDSLAREDRALLIGYDSDRVVGVVRFDITETEVAEVSIYVDPELANRGYGAKLLRAGESWLAIHFSGVRRLIAKVRPENLVSQQLFERAGYAGLYCLYQKERMV